MASPLRPRLLLLLPSVTYRAQAFVEAAHRIDLDLTVGSDHVSTLAGQQPDRLLALDFERPDRVVQAVRAFALTHPVAAVVGVDDDTAVLASIIAEALGRPGNPPAAARAARDKHRQRTMLRAAGVPVPEFSRYALLDDPGPIARATRYPCVLKPLALSASRGVIRADSPEQFVRAHGRLAAILRAEDIAATAGDSYLVESFVPGPEFALEGLLDGGRLHCLALFDKPDPLDGPFFEETIYVTPSRLPPEEQRALIQCAEQAALALGLTRGPIHAELRYNASGPWLIELAARPIGGRCSAVLRFGDAGELSLEELVLRQALGALPTVPPRAPGAAGVMMIPTPRAGVLREVRGQAAARLVPHVTGIVITAHRGQSLVPLPEGSRYLGFIYASAAHPEDAERGLRQAHQQLEIVLE